MVKVGPLLVATAAMAFWANIAQAADLAVGPDNVRSAYHHGHWHPGRCAFVQGVRGGTPLSVPFFANGWSPGPVYEVGWKHCECCTAAAPVVSAMY